MKVILYGIAALLLSVTACAQHTEKAPEGETTAESGRAPVPTQKVNKLNKAGQPEKIVKNNKKWKDILKKEQY